MGETGTGNIEIGRNLRYVAVAAWICLAVCIILFIPAIALDPRDGNGNEALDQGVIVAFFGACALGWVGLVSALARRNLRIAAACFIPAALAAYVVWVVLTADWQ